MPTAELPETLDLQNKRNIVLPPSAPVPGPTGSSIRQILRFVLTGCLNTALDLLLLNGLLWLWPTRHTATLLVYNSIAYTFGAVNSFLLNKYWTFRSTGRVNGREVVRFVLITLAGIIFNDSILFLMSSLLHPVLLNPTLWANISKLIAIGGNVAVSYLGMRLWVFHHARHEQDGTGHI